MSRTSSVLLAAESVAPTNSGIGRVTRLMASVLAAQRDTVDARVLTLSDQDRPRAHDLPVTVARGSRARFLWEATRARPRCGHFIYDFTGMARAHLRMPVLNRPYMTWIHGIEAWEKSRADRMAAARRASMLVVNTNYTRERAARHHSYLADAKVCWLATETDCSAPPCVSDKRPTVMILARVDEGGGYKGHRELIQCWPGVVAAVPRARLVIAGTGPGIAALKDMARASGVGGSIEFRGFIEESAMDALWAEASVFAMPSRGEGFGIVYAEAMRRGVPVIGSVHDAASEVNVDGVTGYNIDQGQPEELLDRLVCLLRDGDHAADLGENGRERWREHFSRTAFHRRFTPLLFEFLAI